MLKNNGKNLSLESKGIKYKLRIAVYLMSILPLLVSIYLISNYVLPKLGFKADIIASVLISIFIAGLGIYVIKEVFDRILNVTGEARLMAAGDFNRRVVIKKEDEIGDLGFSLNKLTERIRSNIDELNNYSKRTQEIEFEIKKRLFILSALLQISSLITQGAKLKDIFKVAVEKSRLLANSDISYLFFRKELAEGFFMEAVAGANTEILLQLKLPADSQLFNKLTDGGKPLILDKDNSAALNLKKDFNEKFGMKSSLTLPVYLKGSVVGMLGIASTDESLCYKKDDIELLDILAKQIAIALENDRMAQKLDKLEVKDALTGLYNEMFIRARLEEEIKRAIAYQRPCAFAVMEVDNFEKLQHDFGLPYAEGALKKIAFLIRDSVTEIDRVARTRDNEFAIVLPERNKRQAQGIIGDIAKKIEFSFNEEEDLNKRLTVSVGVSENPLDGIDTKELFAKAKEALGNARLKKQK